MSKTTTKYFFLAVLAVLIQSCQSSVRFASRDNVGRGSVDIPTRGETPSLDNASETQVKIIKNAEAWLGTPYKWGGNTRSGVDCSGLVVEVFKTVNARLPRTSFEQYQQGKPIGGGSLEVGDLVFFTFEEGRAVTHVGIYAGENKFIHASTSRGVTYQSLYDKPYSIALVGYRRFLKE
ncbi:MAG TPA: C40 family peptidase [Patescibacteria group bacterium]|nr:C40 family peptidase [Patescibacteria group bacterium]